MGYKPEHYMWCDPDNDGYSWKKLLDKFEIDYTGIFDLGHFYKSLHDYLVNDEKWVGTDGAGTTTDHIEYSYVENDMGNDLKGHNIWWRLKQIPDDSEYFMFMIHLNIQTVAMGKTEIVQGDKKIKMDKGEVILRGKIYYIQDYEGKWKKEKMLKQFTKMFRDRYYGNQLGHYKKDLLAFSIRLQNYIKQHLKMSTTQGSPEEQFASPK